MNVVTSEPEAGGDQPARYVIISGYHDYRSKRRANLHFIADELVKRGSVFFFSLRYSYLTRRREDPRHDLWARANRVERVNGVDAYLWRTPIHPFWKEHTSRDIRQGDGFGSN